MIRQQHSSSERDLIQPHRLDLDSYRIAWHAGLDMRLEVLERHRVGLDVDVCLGLPFGDRVEQVKGRVARLPRAIDLPCLLWVVEGDGTSVGLVLLDRPDLQKGDGREMCGSRGYDCEMRRGL